MNVTFQLRSNIILTPKQQYLVYRALIKKRNTKRKPNKQTIIKEKRKPKPKKIQKEDLYFLFDDIHCDSDETWTHDNVEKNKLITTLINQIKDDDCDNGNNNHYHDEVHFLFNDIHCDSDETWTHDNNRIKANLLPAKKQEVKELKDIIINIQQPISFDRIHEDTHESWTENNPLLCPGYMLVSKINNNQ